MELYFDPLVRDYRIALVHDLRHIAALGTDIYGNIQRLDNVLDDFTINLNACQAGPA